MLPCATFSSKCFCLSPYCFRFVIVILLLLTFCRLMGAKLIKRSKTIKLKEYIFLNLHKKQG